MLWLCPAQSNVEEPSLLLSGEALARCGLQSGGLPSPWRGLGNSHTHPGSDPCSPAYFLLSCEV